MASRAQTREGRFVEVSWDFHGVLLGSRVFWALRWRMLKKVLGVGAPCTVLRHAAVQRGDMAFC
jgi:hypothetical protein